MIKLLKTKQDKTMSFSYSDFIKLKLTIVFILELEEIFNYSKKKINKINVDFLSTTKKDCFDNFLIDFKKISANSFIGLTVEEGVENKQYRKIPSLESLNNVSSKEDFLFKKSIIEKINYNNRIQIYKELLNKTEISSKDKKDFLENISLINKKNNSDRKKNKNVTINLNTSPVSVMLIDNEQVYYKSYINYLKEDFGSIESKIKRKENEQIRKSIIEGLSECMDLLLDNCFKSMKKNYPENLSIYSNFKCNQEILKMDFDFIDMSKLITVNYDDDNEKNKERIKDLFSNNPIIFLLLLEGFHINEGFFQKSIKFFSFDFCADDISSSEVKDMVKLISALYSTKKEKKTLMENQLENKTKSFNKKRI